MQKIKERRMKELKKEKRRNYKRRRGRFRLKERREEEN